MFEITPKNNNKSVAIFPEDLNFPRMLTKKAFIYPEIDGTQEDAEDYADY